MKSASLVTTLTSLTTAMAIFAPLVVFGFLYVLRVQPERARELIARNDLHAALSDLERRRAAAEVRLVDDRDVAVNEFGARAVSAERADDLAGAFTALLQGPAVGGVANLGVESRTVGPRRERMTLAFDAKYEQIVRFLRSLRALPSSVDIEAVDVRSNAQTTRATVSLLVGALDDAASTVSHPAAAAAPADAQHSLHLTRRRPSALPPQPDPVVSSILIADGRRVARVDGLIVGPGDRIAAGVVESIEPDAIVVAGLDGRSRRVEIMRPDIRQRAH